MADDLTLRIPNLLRLSKTVNEPTVQREGDIRLADGDGWNPGNGAGLYLWTDSLWRFLGTAIGGEESGWRDQNGNASIRGNPSQAPTWTSWNGNIYQLSFGTASGEKELQFEFHIQHDYKRGSDLYIHTHWSTAATATGDVKWNYEVTYASGYESMAFGTTKTVSVTQTHEGTALLHHIAEVQLSTPGGSATQLDSDEIEVDGLIIVRMYRDSSDGDDTLDVAPFVHFVDMHYQVDRFATLNRNPNFYA